MPSRPPYSPDLVPCRGFLAVLRNQVCPLTADRNSKRPITWRPLTDGCVAEARERWPGVRAWKAVAEPAGKVSREAWTAGEGLTPKKQRVHSKDRINVFLFRRPYSFVVLFERKRFRVRLSNPLVDNGFRRDKTRAAHAIKERARWRWMGVDDRAREEEQQSEFRRVRCALLYNHPPSEEQSAATTTTGQYYLLRRSSLIHIGTHIYFIPVGAAFSFDRAGTFTTLWCRTPWRHRGAGARRVITRNVYGILLFTRARDRRKNDKGTWSDVTVFGL